MNESCFVKERKFSSCTKVKGIVLIVITSFFMNNFRIYENISIFVSK